MFRWTRALSYQLILVVLLTGCFPAGMHLDWAWKKPVVDLKNVSDPLKYQEDRIACSGLVYSHDNSTATIAAETGMSAVKGALTPSLTPSIDPTLDVATGFVGGALGGFVTSSLGSNHQKNRSTAICLINRGYTLLDHDWWIWANESRYHAP
jgi:hypothetical protein